MVQALVLTRALRESGRRAEDEDKPNKSMDVRRKQLLCFGNLSFYPKLARGGFRPRHLNRCVFLGNRKRIIGTEELLQISCSFLKISLRET